MLIKTKANNFQQLQDGVSIQEIIYKCKYDFFRRLEFLFLTQEENQHVFNTKRYQYFQKFSETLTINRQNIVFQNSISITQLKQFCQQSIKFREEIDFPDDAKTIELYYFPYCKQKETICLEKYYQRLKQFADKINICFGDGQFPILTIHIVKIGTINYFYYTVSR